MGKMAFELDDPAEAEFYGSNLNHV